MNNQAAQTMLELRELARRAVPFLRDEGSKYEDDGNNEPLELARAIEAALAGNPNRDAANPGGCECEKCGRVFIGAEWHVLCGICIDHGVAQPDGSGLRNGDNVPASTPEASPQPQVANPADTTYPNPPAAASASERARELLAAEYSDDPTLAEKIRAGTSRNGDVPRAIRALEQALTQQRGEQLGGFQDKALAWDAVCEALGSVSPMWSRNGGTGLLAAVNTIRSLATTTPQPGAEALREYITRLNEAHALAATYSLTDYEKGWSRRGKVIADELESLLARGGE